jgi:hypothetical protein
MSRGCQSLPCHLTRLQLLSVLNSFTQKKPNGEHDGDQVYHAKGEGDGGHDPVRLAATEVHGCPGDEGEYLSPHEDSETRDACVVFSPNPLPDRLPPHSGQSVLMELHVLQGF